MAAKNKFAYLDELENRSIYILREAYSCYRDKLAILWSMGKDSTTMLYLARKAFFGIIPIPVIHIDTGFKFKEIYAFRDKYARKWQLRLIIAKNESALQCGMSPEKGRFDCCNTLKTEALKQAIALYGLKALLLAIRRDEHTIRAKERYFSPRDASFQWNYQSQPIEMWEQFPFREAAAGEHTRIHPMLDWQEVDIWRYIEREKIPVVSLYFAKRNRRYRSIGCQCCCQDVISSASTVYKVVEELAFTSSAERAGRVQDKEKAYMMQRLRALGYM